jgi:hypothetical protein
VNKLISHKKLIIFALLRTLESLFWIEKGCSNGICHGDAVVLQKESRSVCKKKAYRAIFTGKKAGLRFKNICLPVNNLKSIHYIAWPDPVFVGVLTLLCY